MLRSGGGHPWRPPTFPDPRKGSQDMKLIMAIIQPHKLEDVKQALHAIGLQGMTVTEVKGYGRQKGQVEIYRGAEYDVAFVPKVKIEVAIADDAEADAVKAIEKAAKTGRIGDGKIFVVPLSTAIRIRTGESGDTAL